MSTTTPTPPRTYASAITALNSLQSNFAILAAIRSSGKKMNASAIAEMITWLSRIGYTPSDLTQLNLLHVAGTKGKGSTSAFISSILNQYRLSPSSPISKIGLYTSPHLRAVRERIQINGQPIGEVEFTKYFFEVWDRLEESAMKEGRDKADKPVYFRFLTLVAFHAYLREGVDTAVIEVGIGGEYDSTNVIEKPTVVGITSLGIDHVGVLGDTIGEIAWHKAGVFKKGVPAVVVPQVEEAMEVIKKRAEEREVEKLDIIEVGRWKEIADGSVKLGLEGEFQKGNAALAVGMVEEHFRRLGKESGIREGREFPEVVRKGLEEVKWAGRCQTVREGELEWSIDGAHTVESLEAAGKWYGEKKRDCVKNRVLIFNQQNRDAPEKLAFALASSLKKALGSKDMFTHAIFCTNVTFREAGYKPGLFSLFLGGSEAHHLQIS